VLWGFGCGKAAVLGWGNAVGMRRKVPCVPLVRFPQL